MKSIFIILILLSTLTTKPDTCFTICPTPDGCNPNKQRFYLNPVLREENTNLFCCPDCDNCLCVDLLN